MISLFLSKNKTRTTTLDELIDVVLCNKDLLYKEGITNIGGIMLYHIKNDNDDVELSYGTNVLIFEKSGYPNGYEISARTMSETRPGLYMIIDNNSIKILDKSGFPHEIPKSAFDNEIDFFQYTLLNLYYSCTDSSLIKLVNFVKDLTNE